MDNPTFFQNKHTENPVATGESVNIIPTIPETSDTEDIRPLLTDLKFAKLAHETDLSSEVGQHAERLGVGLMPEELAELDIAGQEITAQMSLIELKGNEEEYLAKHKDRQNLEGRYTDPRTEPKFVLSQVEEFAKKAGVEYKKIPELEGQIYSPGLKAIISLRVREQITAFFLNKETGRYNPEKHKMVTEQTERYLSLLEQAQADGDIPKDVKAEDILRMVEENIAKLAFQDRVAAENLMGDHGIRHLVGHNITIAEKIFDQLQGHGQQVKAVDRIMAHQVMIDHDMGYAMAPVRDAINIEGVKGQDAGHNLLAAKFISGREEDKNGHFVRIFSTEQISTIHNGILEHDSANIDFRVGDESPEARRTNIESAIHLADNTHAFEDKLPELLYSMPETLETMRLMKVAGEIGDEALIGELKANLIDRIKSIDTFSEDDKEALMMAAQSLNKNSFKFSVGRICGNKPDISIDQLGKAHVEVEESVIHQEAVGLFGQQSYDQLRKFIADLNGMKKEQVTDAMMNQDSIDTEKLEIKLRIREHRSGEKTDYQERIEQLIKNEAFSVFAIEDDRSGAEQKKLESLVKDGASQETIQQAADLMRTGEADTREGKEIIQKRIGDLKDSRRKRLREYMGLSIQ